MYDDDDNNHITTGVYAWGTGDDFMVEEETEAEPARGKEKQSLTTPDAAEAHQQDDSEQSKGELLNNKVCSLSIISTMMRDISHSPFLTSKERWSFYEICLLAAVGRERACDTKATNQFPPSHTEQDSVCLELQRLFALMQQGCRSYYTPKNLTKALNLKTSIQQDAQEYAKMEICFLAQQFLSH